MNIGERLGKTLRGVNISPRNLSALTKVHYTTIYKLIAQRGKTYPLVEQTLSDALDKIDRLKADGLLPFMENLSDKEKTDRLADLLATND
ncbi:MAG: hypothetical protein V4649_19515 [Bacteroidota bacterium]